MTLSFHPHQEGLQVRIAGYCKADNVSLSCAWVTIPSLDHAQAEITDLQAYIEQPIPAAWKLDIRQAVKDHFKNTPEMP
jgi:hypothetical protein